MKRWTTLATASERGMTLELRERDGEYLVQVDGKVLMGSRRHGSEEALAQVGCAELRRAAPRVLVGGLGCGYTLRAALDALPPAAKVTVAELSPAVVAWNGGPLAALAGSPLSDPRVEVAVEDVARVLADRAGAFDAVLLDVDNGPVAVARTENAGLYAPLGLERLFRALRPGGTAVLWSAGPDPAFERRLSAAGFQLRVEPVRAGAAGRSKHVLFVARRRQVGATP